MLVLSRRPEEKIKIGDNIVVSILGVEGGIVKIGVEAPKEVAILRMEILEQVTKENIEAAAKDVKEITEAAELFKKKISIGKDTGEKKD